MHWGLYYLPTSLPESPSAAAERFQRILDQVRYAEGLGFESVWLAEHHFHAFGGMFASTPVVAAAIAQHTRRMRIGTGVVLMPYHNPLRIAEDYATVDLLSNGRLEFGVGSGFVKWEALNFGIPLDELRERFRENVEVVLQAWTEPTLNHVGRFYQYEGLSVWPRPLQQPHPTVWMGATGTPESFEHSGRQGYHMMVIPFLHPVEEMREKIGIYLAARKAAGHDMGATRVLAVYHVYVREDPGEARQNGRFGVEEYAHAGQSAREFTPGIRDPESYRAHEAHRAAMRTQTFDTMLEGNRVVVGDAREVGEQLRYLRAELHLTDVAGLFALGGLSHEQVCASMRRFMEHVAPNVSEE